MKQRIRLAVFFVVLCFPLSTFALTNISSLPFNCNITGETYVVTADLSAPGSAITVSANGVKIDGNHHTIRYATTSQGNGITFSGDRSNVEIFKLTLVEGAVGGNAIDTGFYSFSNFSVHNCTLTCNTVAANGIKMVNFASDVLGISIRDNVVSVQPTSGTFGNGIIIDSASGASASGVISGNTITMGGTLSTNRPSAIGVLDAPGALDIFGNMLSLRGPDDNNAIKFWGSSGHSIRQNIISMDCYHCRGILIDGGSSNNSVFENNIDMNTTGSCSGIRVRYGSSNNQFYSNTIDSVDAQNGTSCIRHGERQSSNPSNYPSGNKYFKNDLRGISPIVLIENGSNVTEMRCNSITAHDTGIPIRFIIWSAVDPNAITNLTMSDNNVSTNGTAFVSFAAQESQKNQFSDIRFCSGIESSAISNPQSISGFTVSVSSCADPCEPSDLPVSPGQLRVLTN